MTARRRTRKQEDPRAAAEQLTRTAVERLGERLRTAVLFGSVARGEAVVGLSDVNLLLLVDQVDPGLLERLGPAARELAERHGTPPLVMDAAGWSRAGDSFAIEMADMADAHVALHGADPVTDVTVPPAALRLQAERELRVKLLHLREGILVAAGREAELGGLLVTALPSTATYLRAALRLAGREVPPRMDEVIRRGGELVGADTEALLEALEARTGQHPPKATARMVEGFHEAMNRMVDYVDRHVHGEADG